MKVSELISKAEWHTVKHGRMERLAWVDGYLIVMYSGSRDLYVKGPNVAEEELAKLLRVPYPDALLSNLTKKHNWQSHKVKA